MDQIGYEITDGEACGGSEERGTPMRMSSEPSPCSVPRRRDSDLRAEEGVLCTTLCGLAFLVALLGMMAEFCCVATVCASSHAEGIGVGDSRRCDITASRFG